MANSLTVVAMVFSNTLIFLLQKISMYLPYIKIKNFYITLANNFIKFRKFKQK